MRHSIDVAGSLLATLNEQGRGIRIGAAGSQPAELLELYDMEGCPFCRVVREALTDLDLDAMIYPCPKAGDRFRPLVEKLGGKQQFPYLMDPNTDTALYESRAIVEYLYNTYGSHAGPPAWLIKSVYTLTSAGTSALRLGQGIQALENHPPQQPLELYSFEGSPYARIVRELMTQLELPYVLRQSGRDQALDWVLPPIRQRLVPDYEPTQRNRKALKERTGDVAIPCLIDPNTGTELFDSERITDYLLNTYAELE